MEPLNPLPSFVHQANVSQFGQNGTVYRVRTKAGRQVKAWVADPGSVEARRYFCHGHALGTFREFGYTVFSGDDLKTVLQDEWRLVGSLHNGRRGDIVVWHSTYQRVGNQMLRRPGPAGPLKAAQVHNPDHSAILQRVGLNRDGTCDPDLTFLSSKNGGFSAPGEYSLSFLIQTYGDRFAVFRRA
jgi:hypothetical protein